MPKGVGYKGDRRRVWNNPSHSNPDKIYETILWSNGDLTCNCGGWLYPKNGNPRTCRHVKNAEFELRSNQKRVSRPPRQETRQELAEIHIGNHSVAPSSFKKYKRMIRIAEAE